MRLEYQLSAAWRGKADIQQRNAVYTLPGLLQEGNFPLRRNPGGLMLVQRLVQRLIPRYLSTQEGSNVSNTKTLFKMKS